MLEKKIKLLIVDDSILFRETLANFFKNDNLIEVVARASDPFEARDMIAKFRPDVITLDVEMPKMNGIQFLKKLIPQRPIPTVIISSAPIQAFEALEAGAVDYIKKPLIKNPNDMKAFAAEIRTKVITASQAKVMKKVSSVLQSSNISAGRLINSGSFKRNLIAMGASTGGTDALQTVLTAMPENSPPIVIVQHMPPVFTKMFAERLDKLCKINICEAKDGDRLQVGRALIAPGDFHMTLHKDSRGYYVKVVSDEKMSGHRPSVDYLFKSVAKCAGKDAVGVIMTGMGSDGAEGLLQMKNAGAYTIGQDKESCVVYGMPMVAYMKGACNVQTPLSNISNMICNQL